MVYWSILAVVSVGTFMAILDAFIVNVALPTIQSTLRASAAELELVIASYSLTYAVFLITGGRLGDIFGRKRLSCLVWQHLPPPQQRADSPRLQTS